jgi:glycine betaine/choline ABC-type transport system substrate-binding protein
MGRWLLGRRSGGASFLSPIDTSRRLLIMLAATVAVACGSPAPPPPLVVSASADPQNTLLANIYAAGLRYYGTAARVETFDDPLAALDDGKAGVTTGFTGRLLQRFDPRSTARSPEQVYRAMIGALPEGVAAGDYAVAAEDKPALAVTDATTATWGSRELAALVRNCSRVTVGAATAADPPNSVGSCTFTQPREFGTPAMLFDALRSAAVTAAWTTTAATGIPAGVIVLVDRKPALIPAQNVVGLYRRNEMGEMQLRAVNELAGVLDTAALVQMTTRVQGGADPRMVAEEWLTANPLGR